jgi:hypothetical protein
MSKVPTSPVAPVDGKKLLRTIRRFQRESLAGAYYAPFNMNSKNYMDIPPETEAWFDSLGELFASSTQLTQQKDHQLATACFGLLFELIDAMESGKEIVFADEYGSWTIPGDEKRFTSANLRSLAATATPEAFAAVALPLIRRDSGQSFASEVYQSAVRVATKGQRAFLEAEIDRQRIKTKRTA